MRWAVPCVVLALAIGCKKKKEDAPAAESAPADTTAYTIKLPDRAAEGEKWRVNHVKKLTTTATAKAGVETEVDESESEYTQIVIKAKSKWSRAYQSATSTSGGKTKSLPYADSVVMIEKVGDNYTFAIGARRLTRDNAPKLFREFDGDNASDTQERLPKSAVQLNQKWEVDRDVLRKMARRDTNGMDAEKSSISGRLTKAYTSEGKQWGVIEWRSEIVFVAKKTRDMPEKMSTTMTVETPIDGSRGDQKMTLNGGAEWDTGDPKIGKLKVDISETATYTPQ